MGILGKTPEDYGSSGECSSPSPIPTFKEVWQVKVWPKGLGHARNLVGIYRLCLTDKTVNFVKLNSDVAAVVLQLMNVRRCGHSENFFFIEVGRSAITGPGEFWMQVDDSVVAQNMHETLLEAMKALSEEFRQRSKSQSVGTSCGGGSASNPISVPSRRHHPNLPPSQVGFSRRARTETPGGSSTSTSPTSRHGFPRARTASIGARSEEGGASAKGTWASSSPSLNGSCSTTPTLRPKPTRAPTPAKITLSLARYTPNPAPSPAPSLSSSSGHGSECGLVGAAVGGMTISSYPRVSQRVSISGSPSDYGSSDEYGSSPGEHSLLVPNLSGHHIHSEGSSSYIVMGQREGLLGSHHRSKGRRILRRASSRESEAERSLLSKRASLPLTAHERLTPHRKDEDDEADEEYAIMTQSVGHGVAPGPHDVAGQRRRADRGRGEPAAGGPLDSGYMSMLPGVTSPPVPLSLSIGASDAGGKPGDDDEYMAMTPNNSVSPPQHIHQPSSEGYMVMSPNSSSSTDLHGLGMWDGGPGVESRATGDYMNVSPVCSRSACSTPPSHPEQHQLQPKMFNSYFSLPRAYQHTLYTRFEDDLGKGEGKKDGVGPDGAGRGGGGGGVGVAGGGGRGGGYSRRNKIAVGSAGGCQLSMSSSSFSSSSASSESLEDKSVSAGRGLSLLRPGGEQKSAKEGRHHQKRGSSGKSPKQQRRGRPLSAAADMAKANTLPRMKENLLPLVSQSVGEYVSIAYTEGGEECGREQQRAACRRGPPPSHGALRPLNQPLLRHDGPAHLPRSFSAPLATSAEYVSMDLGKPCVAPARAATRGRREHARASSPRPTDAPVPYMDSKSSDGGGSAGPALHSGQPLLMEQEAALGFSPVKSFQSPERSGRLARGELQGRTLISSPSLPRQPPSSSSSSSSGCGLYQEGGQVPGQAPGHRRSLDRSLWESRQAAALCATPPPQASGSSAEQGLNYIDLDLAVKESLQSGVERTSAATYSIGGGAMGGGGGGSGGGPGPGLNTYASIDFYKSEELRAHQSGRKDGQGTCVRKSGRS